MQGILALTSQDFEPDDPSWVTNAAGYNHSTKYGFGVVKATDALTRASTWKSFDVEKQLLNESGPVDLTIADDSTKIVSSSLSFSEWEDGFFVTESVVVYVDIQHPSRGDLKIVLTSPGGTESILHPSKRPENTQLEGEDQGNWKLLTLRAWGEYPTGEWTLSLVDESPGTYGDCLDLPWEYTYASEVGNETLTCADFEWVTDCYDDTQVNPAIFGVLWENRTLLQSCCRCGGGKASASIAPMLRAWKLLVYGHVIQSKDDLLIWPQSSSKPSQGGNSAGNSGGSTSGSENGIPEGSLTFSPVDTENTQDDGWDGRGNSGTFSGGGGTAYMSSGWREKDSDTDSTLLLDQSSATQKLAGLAAVAACIGLAVQLLG